MISSTEKYVMQGSKNYMASTFKEVKFNSFKSLRIQSFEKNLGSFGTSDLINSNFSVLKL